MEAQPGGHSTRIIIARKSERRIAEMIAYNVQDSFGRHLGSICPMVEAGGEEGGLVVHVIITAVEKAVQSFTEGLLTSTHLYQTLHVVRNA